MPELFFKGKEFVYNHHLAVPFRPLIPDPRRSLGESGEHGRLDGNLIIHGDNLHALKALLPLYAGRVDCIFIDPPYNTGNEGWCYNDNVNSPLMREWLAGNPVGIEDGLRHDKWLAMMWPRLRLLHDLLSEGGSLWVTLDDNEVHRARAVLDEVFGEENFVASCIWHKNYSPEPSAQFFSEDHDYLIVYAKSKASWRPCLLERTADHPSARLGALLRPRFRKVLHGPSAAAQIGIKGADRRQQDPCQHRRWCTTKSARQTRPGLKNAPER